MREATVKELIEKLTDDNRHSEVVVIEAILSCNSDYVQHACEILVEHHKTGWLDVELARERAELANKIEKSLK